MQRQTRRISEKPRARTAAFFTATMSDSADDHGIRDRLDKLRCHFTWGLEVEDSEIPDLEIRVWEEIKFGNTKYKAGMHNLRAYVKHLKGQNKDALQSLREAEDLIQTQHAGQLERRILVTWGNYAWVYFHMGRLAEAQTYLEKVEKTYQTFANPSRYRMECPEMDCEEGWALLKCGRKNYERAQACFQKAVDVEPENPEFIAEYAIISHHLDDSAESTNNGKELSLELLRKAVRLNTEDAYLKVLLALKLQLVGQETEGERYIEKALSTRPTQTCVYRFAAKFYQKKRCWKKALELLETALQATPNSSFVHFQLGSCYRKQMFQIKEATSMHPKRKKRKHVKRLVENAIHEFKETLKLNPTFDKAYVYLAGMYAEIGQYEEAEKTFQEVFSLKNLDNHTQQDIHFHYGRFQQLHMKSEDTAITHYKKGLEIKEKSFAREKLLDALEKLAKSRVDRKVQVEESTLLLEFVHKLKEEKEATGL